MLKRKVLITGAGGLLGWHLCQNAPETWDVFGIIFKNSADIPSATLIKTDLTDFKTVDALFAKIKPSLVIHAAAASDPNFCQTHPQQTALINVKATEHLAELCAAAGIKYVFTSSDLVFDGRKALYRESDPVCPISIYGEQKALAEESVLTVNPGAAVCRMPLMYAIDGPVRNNFMPQIVDAILKGQALHLFTDEYRTPLSVRSAALNIIFAASAVSGLIHLGGPDRVSRFAFGQQVANVLNQPTTNFIPCLRASIPMNAPRPSDVSLDSSKARKLFNFSPLPLAEDLTFMLEAG